MKKNLSKKAILAIGMSLVLAEMGINVSNVQANDMGFYKLNKLKEISEELAPNNETRQYSTIDEINEAIEHNNELTINLDNVVSFDKAIEISGKTVTLTSTSRKELTDLKINLKNNSELTIENLNVKSNGSTSDYVIDVLGKGNSIILSGENTFTKIDGSDVSAIKVAQGVTGNDANNELTVKGDGNLTITGYAVGIGDITPIKKSGLIGNDAKNGNSVDLTNKFYAKDNIVINTSGQITINDVSTIGIGYRIDAPYYANVLFSGKIENGDITITTTESGAGIGIHEMTGGNVTIDSNTKVTNDSPFYKPAFAAQTMTGGNLNVHLRNEGFYKEFNTPVKSNIGAHITNVNGGSIDIKMDKKANLGLATTVIKKGDIKITGNSEFGKENVNDSSTVKNPQDGIKFYNFPVVWPEKNNPEDGIKPERVGDVKISTKDVSLRDILYFDIPDVKDNYAPTGGTQQYTSIDKVYSGNALVIGVDNPSGYDKLIINGDYVAGDADRINYIFFDEITNEDTLPITASVTKNGKMYPISDDGTQKNIGVFTKDNKLIELKNAQISEEELENAIYVTNGNNKYKFEIISNSISEKEVALVGHEKVNTQELLEGKSFENGIVTTEYGSYKLTSIGNGQDSLTSITEEDLKGHLNEVKEIKDKAFKGNKNINEIQLPKVSNIGDLAFAETNVSKLSLGNELANEKEIKIGKNAFDSVTTLKQITTNNERSMSNIKEALNNCPSVDIEIKSEGKIEIYKPTVQDTQVSQGEGGSAVINGAMISSENKTETIKEETAKPDMIYKQLSYDEIKLPTENREPIQFKDVSENHWAKSYIDKLSSMGIINGIDDKFESNKTTKRGDLTIMLVKLLGLQPESNNLFKDVNEQAYYAPYIGAASKYNIINGYEGEFKPEQSMTRQDTMVVISRVLNQLGIESNANSSSLEQFADLKEVSGYAVEHIATLVNSGIITGSNGKLNPKAPVTRAEMATIMSKLYDILDQAK